MGELQVCFIGHEFHGPLMQSERPIDAVFTARAQPRGTPSAERAQKAPLVLAGVVERKARQRTGLLRRGYRVADRRISVGEVAPSVAQVINEGCRSRGVSVFVDEAAEKQDAQRARWCSRARHDVCRGPRSAVPRGKRANGPGALKKQQMSASATPTAVPGRSGTRVGVWPLTFWFRRYLSGKRVHERPIACQAPATSTVAFPAAVLELASSAHHARARAVSAEPHDSQGHSGAYRLAQGHRT